MPLPKPSSKSVSRRIKKTVSLELFQPPAPPKPAPIKLPPPLPILKERLVRVICTDPDATDSSSDEDDHENDYGEQPPISLARKRLIREICLPGPSHFSAGFLRDCNSYGVDVDPVSVLPSKLPRRNEEPESSSDSLQEDAHSRDRCSDGLSLFPSDLFPLPESVGASAWQTSWLTPQDDFLKEVDLELDFEQFSSWFDSLQRHV